MQAKEDASDPISVDKFVVWVQGIEGKYGNNLRMVDWGYFHMCFLSNLVSKGCFGIVEKGRSSIVSKHPIVENYWHKKDQLVHKDQISYLEILDTMFIFVQQGKEVMMLPHTLCK